MAVNLSPVGGVAAQFFDNNGVPLAGGKLFTYLAGTTTPATTYTLSNGATAWANPIVLDSAGRVPSSGEIWITNGILYKFILKDANDVLIATYDNIAGINSVDAENVSYTAPYLNSVTSNVEAKLAQYVSPLDFGAVGNGSTADNAKLALTAAACPGRLLNGSGKTYAITANLPTGWRMLDGQITDSRTVNYTDQYSVVGIGQNVLAANTFIPEQHSSSYPAPFTYWASGNHLVAIGGDALAANTTGRRNTAVGSRCMPVSTTAYYNTAVGSHSMEKLTTGNENVAVGVQALNSVTNGSGNTGVGTTAGTNITTGNNNSFGGNLSGTYCTTGSGNTGFGYRAAFSITTADDAVAFGRDALVSCTTGIQNTAVGANSAINVITGANNVAMGWSALRQANTSNNTAIGTLTLFNATGAGNNVFGYRAGYSLTTGSNNNFFGRDSGLNMLTGSSNTIVGSFNGTTGIDISTLNNRVILSDGDGNVREYYDNAGRGYVNTFTAGAGIGYNARWSVNGGSEDASVFRVDNFGAACVNAWNSATSGNNVFAYFATESTATARGTITYNRSGGLTSYNTTSDYRAKDIIGPVQNPGAVIDALKVYTGKMKGATIERPMLIAHEAQLVTPYAVTGEKNAVDENGNPDLQQMDVSALVPLLIAEIKSLRARVATLETAK